MSADSFGVLKRPVQVSAGKHEVDNEARRWTSTTATNFGAGVGLEHRENHGTDVLRLILHARTICVLARFLYTVTTIFVALHRGASSNRIPDRNNIL